MTELNAVISAATTIGAEVQVLARGNGIDNIALTGTTGLVDTYTITFTNGSTTTFTVTNGADGDDGVSVTDAEVNASGHLIVTLSSGTTIDTGAVKGADGNGISGVVLNANYTLTINFTDGTSYTTPSIRGEQGETGNGIASVALISGNHAAGTSDTYRITFTDATTFDFAVYNGVDGSGSGDMSKSVYDAANKAGQIATEAELTAHTGASGIHVTSAEKTDWNGKYAKPSGGVPKTDLASDVRTTLGRADTAVQMETDPTVPNWAKTTNKPTYTAAEVGADASGAAASVQGNLNTHTGRTDNPHGVTAAQVGARPSTWTPTAAQVGAEPSGAVNTHNAATDAHAALFGSKQNDIGFSVDANGIITRIIGGVTEYVNPPMIAGTEYRTTERFSGLPVYAKMISCGALPNTGRKDVSHGITNLKQFVSCSGTTSYAQGILTMPYFGGTTGEYTASAHKTSIVLLTTTDATAFTETYITLKYTKTTD